jgi:hypothetical protein
VEAIEPLLAEAETLDPENPRIKRNRQAVSANPASSAKVQWEDPAGVEDSDGLDGALLEMERLKLNEQQQANLAERGLLGIGA